MTNKNLGIVGFSYQVTSKDSKAPWKTDRTWGQQTSQKVEIAHGYNWSNSYHCGYGHSFIHLGEQGPFWSIVGGYTDHTSNDSSAPNLKDNEWGITTKDKYCLREGYAWDHILNREGYSRTYVYLLPEENVSNVCGLNIQSTSKDSRAQWIKTNHFGSSEGKEIKLTGSYGWSECYGEGYNWFFIYLNEEQKLVADLERKKKLDEELIRNNLENLELKRVQRKVEQLEGTIEDFGSELLAIKRKDLKQLVNNYKSKLDNSLHGYLDIFIQTNNQLAKRELLKKFDEKALKELSEKQQVINQLEDKINKLSQQAQIEVLPPAYN
ncbi:MAG: coiled-coil domain-containing protein [Spiroplasmataceae bacterium]|nr:coiled-coil domain-containing protein [Spiroplasmataceae bacterium]